MNIQDVPALAPYFFVEPDLAVDDAWTMRRGMLDDDYGE
jgi:glutamyl-tRNA synthetase